MNTLVTTINPGLNSPVPEIHPCQKSHNELLDDMQDYIELINKLQRHTRCSPSYCLRIDPSRQQICRFGYPKEISHQTYIRDDGHGQPELITARNDPLINPHNRLQLQGWRANVDFKPILSIHAALQYISKYASKAETRSGAFSDIYNQILCASNPDDPSLNSIQKLLLQSISERDISAQETSHLLLGIPLYHSSRSFVSLNLNREAPRVLGNDTGRTTKSALKKYWDRPAEFEEFSLFQLNLRYKIAKGHWVECKKENIVRIWPRPSPIYQGPQWEEFCRIKVILHVPHRSLEQLTENDTISWSTLYEHFSDVINNDPPDLLGLSVDNEKEIAESEGDDLDDIEEDINDEYRPDWMLLAEMGPNAIIDHSSDLGNRDIDRQHDWLNDGKQHYNDSDIINANSFLRQTIENEKSKDTIEANVNEHDETIDYETLNEKQEMIFERIKSHYQNILASIQVDPLRIIIMGTAGTGKSYLIKALQSMFREMTRIESKIPLLVLAPTGVAAFNVRGKTIHSALSIPIFNGANNNSLDITGESLKKLQEKLEGIKYIIIDEKSMVGRRMLGMIDIRLRQAFPEYNNKPFGGRSVILTGDFGQLPPVLDLPMYSSIQRDPLSNDGFVAYRQFHEVYKLDLIQRQSGDSESQQKFRDILLRLRDGESTITDWEELTLRFEEKQSIIEKDKFKDSTLVLPTWDDVDAVNMEKLRSLNCPIAKIKAVHTGGSEAKNADSDTAKGLESQLLLAKGACIMLTANLWTKFGLVNGSIGYVQDIIFEKEGPPYLPSVIFIKFDNYQGPTIRTLDGIEVVPIIPVQRSWESKKGQICSRLQFPICLAWALTTHKSQGLTIKRATVGLGKKEFAAGLSFVAISRVRSLEDLLFRSFSYERLERIKNCKRLQERKEEEIRLLSMSYNRISS
jgi:ATP-dependent DNA helicase PIF1